MTRTTAITWVAAFVAAGFSVSPVSAQTRPANTVVATGAPVSIWDGVFTRAQATRGEQTARTACFQCHGARDWTNPGLLQVWSGRPFGEMYEYIRSTMPADGPSSRTRQEYADIMSYLLQLNGAPEGASELPSTEEGLSAIEIRPRPNP